LNFRLHAWVYVQNCGARGRQSIRGIRVAATNGWFAARPSRTEPIYKIYAESFSGEEHLARI